LQFKIFVKVQDGQVSSLGEARTRQKGIARLMEFLRGLGELERLAILHTNAEADARQFLADYNPDERITPIVVHVTPVIGVHVGPNGLGFAVVVR
jgi:fatty acid-binding protein DegV